MIRQLLNRLFHKVAQVAPGGGGVRPALHRLRGVKIGRNVWISQYVYIDEIHPDAVSIGDNCTIGIRTSILTHFYWGPRRKDYDAGKVVIGKDVFIGPHCVVLPGVSIGEGSVIMAGSVVAKDVPAHTFWGPPQAGPIGRATVPLTNEHSYDQFVAGLKPFRKGSPPARNEKTEVTDR